MTLGCDHEWVSNGMIQPTLVPAYAVLCTKCLHSEWRRFGAGKPRIAWVEYYHRIGLEPPTLKGRDMTKCDGPAVPDRGDQ